MTTSFLSSEDLLKVPDDCSWIVDKASSHITSLTATFEQRLKKQEEAFQKLRTEYNGLEQQGGVAALRREHEKAMLDSKVQLERAQAQVALQAERLSASEELAMRRQTEVDNLRNELKGLEEKLLSNTKRQSELLASLDDAQSSSLPAKLSVERLKLEVENLKLKNEQKDAGLKEKMEQLLEAKREFSGKTREFETALEENSSRIALLESAKLRLEQDLEASRGKCKDIMDQLSQSKADFGELEQAHEQELETQVQLTQLHKNASESAAEQISQLEAALAEVQEALARVHAVHEEKVASQLKEFNEQMIEVKKDRDVRIQELENALNVEKEKCESLRVLPVKMQALSDSAASAELERRGMSMTELYKELMAQRKTSNADKAEIKRLNDYLNRILHDIESKAPAIARLREDYERAIAAYDETSVKLVNVMKEYNEMRSYIDDIEKDRDAHREQSIVATQESRDLAQQVQTLLKAQVQSVYTPTKVKDNSAVLTTLSVGDVISENLVTVSGVEEMQKRNQQLLKVIRQLSKEREDEEVKAKSTRETQLDRKLQATMTELQQMKDSRKSQQEMVAVIVNQRDMYRSLLAQADALHKAPAIQDKAAPPVTQVESSNALEELRKEYDGYKQESKASAEALTQALEQAREKIASLALSASEAKNTSEFHAARAKDLSSIVEEEKAENTRLKTLQAKLETQLSEHQKLLQDKAAEMETGAERERLLSSESNSLRVEKRLLEEETKHLQQRVEDLQTQLTSHARLAETFQALEASMKAEQASTMAGLRQDKTSLQSQVSTLQTRVRELEHQGAQDSSGSDVKLKQAQRDLASSVESTRRLEEQIAVLKTKLEASESKQELLNKQLSATNKIAAQVRELRVGQPTSAPAASSSSSTPAVVDAETAAQQSKDVEAFQQIAQGAEAAMVRLNERLKESQELAKKQAAELSVYKTKLASASGVGAKAREELTKRVSTLESQLKEYNAMEVKLKSAEEKVSVLTNDISLNKQRLETAVANYERELQLHASDSTALAQLRNAYTDLQKAFKTASSDLVQAKQTIDANDEEKKKLENTMRAQLEASVKDVALFRRQNELLSAQLTHLTEQAKLYQRQQLERSIQEGVAADENVQTQEIVRLREIVEIANRHKSETTLKMEEAQHEVKRLKQQLASTKLELQTLAVDKDSLKDKKVLTVTEHKNLLAQLQETVVLRNMNAYITAGQEKLKEQLAAAESRAEALLKKSKEVEQEEPRQRAKLVSLQAEMAALKTERDTFKARYEALMARFGEKVDPGEHERLKKSQTELERRVKMQGQQLQMLTVEKTNASKSLLEAQETMKKLKGMVLKYRRTDEQSKESLKGLEKRNQELTNKLAVALKAGKAERELNTKLTATLKAKTAAAAAASSVKPTPQAKSSLASKPVPVQRAAGTTVSLSKAQPKKAKLNPGGAQGATQTITSLKPKGQQAMLSINPQRKRPLEEKITMDKPKTFEKSQAERPPKKKGRTENTIMSRRMKTIEDNKKRFELQRQKLKAEEELKLQMMNRAVLQKKAEAKQAAQSKPKIAVIPTKPVAVVKKSDAMGTSGDAGKKATDATKAAQSAKQQSQEAAKRDTEAKLNQMKQALLLKKQALAKEKAEKAKQMEQQQLKAAAAKATAEASKPQTAVAAPEKTADEVTEDDNRVSLKPAGTKVADRIALRAQRFGNPGNKTEVENDKPAQAIESSTSSIPTPATSAPAKATPVEVKKATTSDATEPKKTVGAAPSQPTEKPDAKSPTPAETKKQEALESNSSVVPDSVNAPSPTEASKEPEPTTEAKSEQQVTEPVKAAAEETKPAVVDKTDVEPEFGLPEAAVSPLPVAEASVMEQVETKGEDEVEDADFEKQDDDEDAMDDNNSEEDNDSDDDEMKDDGSQEEEDDIDESNKMDDDGDDDDGDSADGLQRAFDDDEEDEEEDDEDRSISAEEDVTESDEAEPIGVMRDDDDDDNDEDSDGVIDLVDSD